MNDDIGNSLNIDNIVFEEIAAANVYVVCIPSYNCLWAIETENRIHSRSKLLMAYKYSQPYILILPDIC